MHIYLFIYATPLDHPHRYHVPSKHIIQHINSQPSTDSTDSSLCSPASSVTPTPTPPAARFVYLSTPSAITRTTHIYNQSLHLYRLLLATRHNHLFVLVPRQLRYATVVSLYHIYTNSSQAHTNWSCLLRTPDRHCSVLIAHHNFSSRRRPHNLSCLGVLSVSIPWLYPSN